MLYHKYLKPLSFLFPWLYRTEAAQLLNCKGILWVSLGKNLCILEGKAGAGPKNECIIVRQVVPFHSYNYVIVTFNWMFSASQCEAETGIYHKPHSWRYLGWTHIFKQFVILFLFSLFLNFFLIIIFVLILIHKT